MFAIQQKYNMPVLYVMFATGNVDFYTMLKYLCITVALHWKGGLKSFIKQVMSDKTRRAKIACQPQQN